ncbi:MAG: hypothetical protein GY934_07595, partial [Gammaproteobacteria bacterium]|nr:hypothetical protein [Gammaproteobacteria bacterium]
RASGQQGDEFLGMAPPNNGVNYCDIDFGVSDELPAGSSWFVPPAIGVSAPPVFESGRMDSFGWNESLGNQGTFSEEVGCLPPSADGRPARGRSEEFRKVHDQPLKATLSITGRGDGQAEWPIRPGRINYRERTFYGRHGHEG